MVTGIYVCRAVLILVAATYASVTIAQSVNTGMEAPVQEVLISDVDMISGYLTRKYDDLVVGEVESTSELKLTRTYRSSGGGTGYASFAEWEHSFKVYATNPIDPSSGYFRDINIVIGQETHLFSSVGDGSYVNLLGDGSQVSLKTQSGLTTIEYVSRHGDVVNFKSTLDCSYVINCILADRIKKSDGTVIHLHYEVAGYLYSGNELAVYRLKKVANSFGYGLSFSYVDDGVSGVVSQPRLTVDRIGSIKTNCPNQVSDCGDINLSTASYVYDSIQSGQRTYLRLRSSDSSAGVHSYLYDEVRGRLKSITAGDANAAEFTVTWADPPWGYGYASLDPFVSAKTDASGNTVTYAWSLEGGVERKQSFMATDAAGAITKFSSRESFLSSERSPARILTRIVLASGGLIEKQYDEKSRVKMIISPELNSSEYIYDDRGNIEKTINRRKDGNLTDVHQQIDKFPTECPLLELKRCNKRTSHQDANGTYSSFVWSPSHGGIMEMIEGLDSNGICRPSLTACPKTEYSYQQFNTPDSQQVFLLSSTMIKVSDNVQNRTGYLRRNIAPFNIFQKNEEEITNGVVTRRLVTCYAFDPVGNLISTTKPRADILSCQ